MWIGQRFVVSAIAPPAYKGQPVGERKLQPPVGQYRGMMAFWDFVKEGGKERMDREGRSKREGDISVHLPPGLSFDDT